MKLWILTKKKNCRFYPQRRFIEEAEKMGIELKTVVPEDFEIVEPMQEPNSILYKHRPVELPDCLLPRMGSGTTYFALMLIRYLQRKGVFVLNDDTGISNAKDKLQTIQKLSEANIPIPKTILAKFPISTRFVQKEFKFPVILKTISGSQGKGVVLCETKNSLEDITKLISKTANGENNIIIQEFISESRGKDIRVYVLGGRAIGAMLRTSRGDKFKANFSSGGKVENYPLNPELEWLAVESSRIVGLELAGVDILFDKNGYKVCEVNSNPGFKGLEKATGLNIPQEIFNFLQVRLKGRIK
ncbi:MAG: RimK family alpha-L-glutamate ligase [Candidatus Aenigmarchaeota archaeon]|nr:RimK family alpha-L-glutamate ligase [Candidatus Aenigmarchaeota archaeon]